MRQTCQIVFRRQEELWWAWQQVVGGMEMGRAPEVEVGVVVWGYAEE